MELPIELRLAIEKQIEGFKHSELKQDASNISIKYRNENANCKRLTLQSEAMAYSLTRMPATYGAVYTALSYTLKLSEIRPASLLDVGAGTGAATWAANELLDLDSIVCLEREKSMLALGQNLMKNSSLSDTKWVSSDIINDEMPNKADLTISSYVLNEIDDVSRNKVIEKLWNATNMILLIVEPGTPASFTKIMKTRDQLIELGAHIVAPCPHETSCHLKQDDWCHFTCRVARSSLHRQLKDGDAPYEDEKFSYLAFSRENTEHAVGRILRHPLIEKGRITLEVCNEKNINKVTVYKKDDLFKYARKAKCGDEINIENT